MIKNSFRILCTILALFTNSHLKSSQGPTTIIYELQSLSSIEFASVVGSVIGYFILLSCTEKQMPMKNNIEIGKNTLPASAKEINHSLKRMEWLEHTKQSRSKIQ